MANDQTAILELLRSRERAVHSGDAEAAIADVMAGAAIYDLPPPLAYNHDAGEAVDGLNGWFSTWNGPVSAELHNPEVQISGDLAAVWGLSRMRGDKKGQGPTDIWFRTSVILRRTRTGWEIIHEHNSVPLKMDGSGAAAVDLKPE